MYAIPRDEFLAWAADRGIGPHPGFPDTLAYLPPREHARFWTLPDDPAGWPRFITKFFRGFYKESFGYLWPRTGRWPPTGYPNSYKDGVRDVLLRGAGLPSGWQGALRFRREEIDELVAILFITLLFGTFAEDDLFFIPESGRYILQTDHHDVVHAKCPDEVSIRDLVRFMAEADYDLPREPPDWTFKRPAWMDEGPVE